MVLTNPLARFYNRRLCAATEISLHFGANDVAKIIQYYLR